MLRSLLLMAGILALVQAPAPAAETWSWNTANFSVLKTSRWQASILTSGRTGHGLGTPRQERAGSIAKLRIAPRLTALGGYYYYRDSDDAHHWRTTQRAFAGVEAPVFKHGRMEVETRLVAERYLPDYKADFTRVRPRARVSSLRRFGTLCVCGVLFRRRTESIRCGTRPACGGLPPGTAPWRSGISATGAGHRSAQTGTSSIRTSTSTTSSSNGSASYGSLTQRNPMLPVLPARRHRGEVVKRPVHQFSQVEAQAADGVPGLPGARAAGRAPS